MRQMSRALSFKVFLGLNHLLNQFSFLCISKCYCLDGTSPIYINDDLTARRAKLSFDTRILKREKRIQDCWTAFGKVVVKTTTNLIKEIKSQADLQNI